MPASDPQDVLADCRQVVLILRLVLDRQAQLRHGEVIDSENVSHGKFMTLPGLMETVSRWLEREKADTPVDEDLRRPCTCVWQSIVH